MKLDHYISQLLFRYDCVIVPNLGGFVTNYKPASINPVKDTFYPPSKGISFNKNLSHNDGLLANAISQDNDISYEKVLKIIEEAVFTIQQELKNRKKVAFENVGVLFYDHENRLQFEPSATVNYLLESYGLSSFQQFPVKRKTLEDKIKETPVLPISGSKNTKKWIAAAAVFIPLAFLTIWIPTKFDIGSELNYANLNPFKTATPVYTERASALPTIKKSVTPTVDENTQTIQFIANEKPIVITQPTVEETAKVDSTYVETKQQKANFHVVGGCFAEKQNAQKFVQELINAGFEASIIGKRKGLFTVSYSGFSTRQEAVEGLAKVKNHNKKAWILAL
ncbi:MAG: SPOR domain-containing protein [Flavobacteriales bacterium]|nr:MAG: SPOR domain-containing protein [Flavobacteriales bacterium]